MNDTRTEELGLEIGEEDLFQPMPDLLPAKE